MGINIGLNFFFDEGIFGHILESLCDSGSKVENTNLTKRVGAFVVQVPQEGPVMDVGMFFGVCDNFANVLCQNLPRLNSQKSSVCGQAFLKMRSFSCFGNGIAS